MSYYTHPAYQQQHQSVYGYGNTGTISGRIANVKRLMDKAEAIPLTASKEELKIKKFNLESAIQQAEDGIKLYSGFQVATLKALSITAQQKLAQVKEKLKDKTEFKLVDIESDQYSWATGIDKKALTKAGAIQVKRKEDLLALMHYLEDSYALENKGKKKVTLNYSIPESPTDSLISMVAYSNAFKDAKKKLAGSPDTQGALVKAASWFWTNVEKPFRDAEEAAGRGESTADVTSSSTGKSSKRSSSKKTSETNPYAIGAFQLRPFFRKNNVWMYTTGVLLIGGLAYYFWPED